VSWDDGIDGNFFSYEGPWSAPDDMLPPGAMRGRALAAVRPPGGRRFGAPELVSLPDEDVAPPAVAFDARTAQPVLLWWSLKLSGDPQAPIPGSEALYTAARG
jgi:hypothetical protein